MVRLPPKPRFCLLSIHLRYQRSSSRLAIDTCAQVPSHCSHCRITRSQPARPLTFLPTSPVRTGSDPESRHSLPSCMSHLPGTAHVHPRSFPRRPLPDSQRCLPAPVSSRNRAGASRHTRGCILLFPLPRLLPVHSRRQRHLHLFLLRPHMLDHSDFFVASDWGRRPLPIQGLRQRSTPSLGLGISRSCLGWHARRGPIVGC